MQHDPAKIALGCMFILLVALALCTGSVLIGFGTGSIAVACGVAVLSLFFTIMIVIGYQD